MTEWFSRHWLALALSIALAVGLFFVLRVVGLPVVPPRALLLRIAPGAIALHTLLYFAAIYVRAYRWVWLLRPIPEARDVPVRRIVAASFVGYGAMILMPFRTGEVVRPALLREKGKLSGWTLAGTVAAERIVDGLVLMALLLGSMFLAAPSAAGRDAPIPVEAIWRASYLAFAAFGAALALLVAFYFRRDAATRLLNATIGRLSARLGERLAATVGRLADGLVFLFSAGHSARVVAATLAYFALFAASIWVMVAGSGMGAPDFVQACVVAGLMHLGAMLPNAPGYFGAYQLSIYAGLAMFYPAADVSGVGSAVVFALYALQMGLPLVLAVVALAFLRMTPARAMAAALRAEEERPMDG